MGQGGGHGRWVAMKMGRWGVEAGDESAAAGNWERRTRRRLFNLSYDNRKRRVESVVGFG